MNIVVSLIALGLFCAVAWKDVKYALWLLPLLLPTYLVRFSIGPIPFTLLEAFLLATIGVWAIKQKEKIYRGDRRFTLPLILLFLSSILGLLAAEDIVSALGIWKAYFLEPALIFIVLLTTFTKKEHWEKLFMSLGVSALLLSSVGIIQYLFGIGIPAPWDIERRVTSIFDYPNALGLFLAPIVSVAIMQTITSRGKELIFWVAVILFGLAGIILAKTEAALVAIPAALFFGLILSPIQLRSKYLITFGAAVLGVLALIMPFTREKLFLQDYSGQVRLSQWEETAKLIADNPIFGAGLNTYPSAIVPYHDFGIFEIFQYPHNIVFNIWVELGILGVLTFAYLGVESVKRIKNEKMNDIALISFVALLTMTVHGFVDVPYFKNDLSVLTWMFIAAFIFSLKEHNKRNNHQDNQATKSKEN